MSVDVVLRGGTIYGGSGGEPYLGDVAMSGERIAHVGERVSEPGGREVDVRGLAVAPGFINMLSWSTESLIQDGRSQSDIRQGVTLEVMGEGASMGPLNATMKRELKERQSRITYDVTWTTLDEYLEHLVARGVSCNVASFVGATTLRINALGYEDRAPNEAELTRMRRLVREAMEDGAMGVGASLIYAPAFYAGTDELVALCEEAAAFGGRYIAHLRSEGNRFIEALDELIEIARRAAIGAEVYHLKAAGSDNWGKLDAAIARIEEARASGLKITADMYTYTAGATGLDAAMPPWVQEGGHKAWAARLKDAAVRERVRREMSARTDEWENLLLAAGPDQTLLVSFKNDDLRHLTGMTLADVAASRGQGVEECAMDLVIEDDSRVGTAYFMMSEENVRRQMGLPWVSFGSDAPSVAPDGVFLASNPHPRAYGTFARVLGKYAREERALTLAEAVRRLTSLPAENLKLDRRGALREGYFGDVVVFDPAAVQDHATFDRPHQYATGVAHVFVNGTHVLADGEHTGATPGQVVRGPGWRGRRV